MWHCDLLEKFAHHALARFVQLDPKGGPPSVKRVQLTLDTATHPTPGQHYEFVKDEETGAESFTPWTPPQRPAPTPVETKAAASETTAANPETVAAETSAAAGETVQ